MNFYKKYLIYSIMDNFKLGLHYLDYIKDTNIFRQSKVTQNMK